VSHISWTTPVLWLTCEHRGFNFKNASMLGIVYSTDAFLLLKHRAVVSINAPRLQYFRTRPMPIVQCTHQCFNVLSALMPMVCEAHCMEKHPLQPPPAQMFLVIMNFCYKFLTLKASAITSTRGSFPCSGCSFLLVGAGKLGILNFLQVVASK
jgi:hypothetical protein